MFGVAKVKDGYAVSEDGLLIEWFYLKDYATMMDCYQDALLRVMQLQGVAD